MMELASSVGGTGGEPKLSYFGCEGIVEEHMTFVLSILLEHIEVWRSDASIGPRGKEAITGAI
jgi:hypothetical protein